MQLFLRRLHQLDASFQPTPADLEQSAEICRLLEGMPLAIELAAGWARNLPLAEIKGIQVTRQGTRIYADELVRRTDPRGRPYYWIGGEAPSGVPDEGTDIGALSRGYVSVTPLQLDLTAHPLLKTMQEWTW